MKWKNRRQSKNVQDLDEEKAKVLKTSPKTIKEMNRKFQKSKETNLLAERARGSSLLSPKPLSRTTDRYTDDQNYVTNVFRDASGRKLKNLKDSAKPQHLIPSKRKTKVSN